MQLLLKDDLPFVNLKVSYLGQEIEVSHVLVDTGSGSTILAAEVMSQIGLVPQSEDMLYLIRGVGGVEAVFTRQIDYLQIDQHRLPQFEIEIGGMDYGFEINGILGMDVLLAAGALIKLQELQLEFTKP